MDVTEDESVTRGLRYPVGTTLQKIELFLKGLAPYALYERVLARVYKV